MTCVCSMQLFKISSAWTLKKYSVAFIGKFLNNISCCWKHSILKLTGFPFMLCLKLHLINERFIYIEIQPTPVKWLRKINLGQAMF